MYVIANVAKQSCKTNNNLSKNEIAIPLSGIMLPRDDKISMDNDLKALGLTWNEIKVYKSLLKLGETAVGGIINDLKVHRQIAYNALDSLEKRGMVERAMKNRVHHFKVADPNLIIENVQKQEMIAKRLSQNITKELKKSRREHEINIYNGQIGVRKFYINAFKKTPKGASCFIMGVDVEGHVRALGEDFITGTYNKIKNERKIFGKLVLSEKMRPATKEFEKKVNPQLRQSRYLPYENLNPISTTIWPDRVSFLSTGKDVFVVEVINKAFRDSFVDHFNLLWKIARK